MALTNDLISQFVKITNDKPTEVKETTLHGNAVVQGSKTYVKLDGSEELTPVHTTAAIKDGERVTVMIKDHTAIVTGNISSPSARTEDVDNAVDEITELEIVVADKASIGDLSVERGRIDDLQADNVLVKNTLLAAEADIDNLQAGILTVTDKLTATEADIENLQTTKLDASVATITYATIEDLKATNADIYNLEATYGDFVVLSTDKFEAIEAEIAKLEAGEISVEQLKATFATIKQLEVEQARIDDLEVSVADIDTLIFGSASGSVIQTSFANAVIAQLGNAQIKSAMIESLSASKLTSGDIITNNVRVMSDDGKLLISDETIQISDNARVRVQIGKDSAGDYSINIWDADGKLMFSEGGITDSAIKEAIIRDDMVSDTANISAHKLNIESLFEEINGSTHTIKSSKILVDSENQTLDVVFTDLITDISELEDIVRTQGTSLSVVQGQISSKVWQQDIDASTDEMNTKYSLLEQTVDDMNLVVSSHTAEINAKAEQSTVNTVIDQVSNLEVNLSGFKTTVSNTYATKTELNSIEIGGRNLIKNSDGILMRNSDNGNNNVWTIEDGYVKLTPVANGNVYANRGIVATTEAREQGETYTLSFEVLSPTNIGLYWYPSEKYTINNMVLASENWQKISYTYTQTGETTFDNSTTLLLGFYNLVAGNEYCYRHIKLEKGNKATDWSPAPEDLEEDVFDLEDRVTKAESTISQNAESIELMVTKTELSDLESEISNTYTTKSEMESSIELTKTGILSTVSSNYATKDELTASESKASSAIEQKANSILSTVSSTYATKQSLENTISDVAAAQDAAEAAQADIDALTVGGRNLFKGYNDGEIELNVYQNVGSFTQFKNCLTFNPCETVGETYTISFWAKSPNGSTPLSIYNQNGAPRHFYFGRTLMTSALGDEWEYFTHTLTNVDMGEAYTDDVCNRLEFYASAQTGVLVKRIKVEKGNIATDWTPAPEDMATADDLETVQSSAELTEERVTTAESLIQQLSDSISMLVTDGNGESLMVQTESGWTFSTAQIQSMVDATSENLNNLFDEMGSVNLAVDALQQSVDDLGVLNDYVKITTYEGEPCIELGETDSDFKLLITNTRIMFMEGSSVPAYINNQSLHIKKAVIEEELQQGEFVWKTRNNGNLGLIWKGATS